MKDDAEREIFGQLRKSGVIKAIHKLGFSKKVETMIDKMILQTRKGLGVSCLLNLEKIAPSGTFRAGNAETRPAVMGAWLLLAKRVTNNEINGSFDVDRMQISLPN